MFLLLPWAKFPSQFLLCKQKKKKKCWGGGNVFLGLKEEKHEHSWYKPEYKYFILR